MRVFEDDGGNAWDVVVGRESYGTVVAMFFPKSGSELPRQALLDVKPTDEGTRMLRDLSMEALRALLRDSVQRET